MNGQEGATIGSVCSGYGGLDLGVASAIGGRLAWVADDDRHVHTILRARAPGVPNLGDIATTDWTSVEPVDVLTAGFPCQDISAAGKGAGIIEGTRSGIWRHVATAIRVLRPALVVVENVAALRWRVGGLDVVLGDLAAIGYDTRWCCVRASDVGAPHRRERVFILAHPVGHGGRRVLADARGEQSQRRRTARHLACPPGPTQATEERWLHRHVTVDRGTAPAYPVRDQQSEQPTGDRAVPLWSWPGASRRNTPRPHPTRAAGEPNPGVDAAIDWADYTTAIRRWEHISGIAAPPPVEPGRKGRLRLSARFVEWMMGIPPGWVTDLDIPRTAQLRALGNGVVPLQARHAITQLIADDDSELWSEMSTRAA